MMADERNEADSPPTCCHEGIGGQGVCVVVDLAVHPHDNTTDMGSDREIYDKNSNIFPDSHGLDRVNRRAAAGVDLTTGFVGLFDQLLRRKLP